MNHPNVVQIIEMNEADGNPYFVMEYVHGTSLDAVMQRRRLSLTEAFGIFKEVCKGLQAAHRQNIVHRDLNPRNVLVSEDLSVVKLADFGISRVESISRAEGTLSTGNIAMGTLHYMAPEQVTGMDDVDHRADIYSLGVLLYEMLTGRIPVGRFNLPSQLEQGVPPEVDPLVLRCLSADPGDRYPTVDRVLEAVTKLEDQLRLSFAQDFKGLSRSTSKLFSRSTSKVTRRPVLIAAALVAVVVLGAVFFGSPRPAGPRLEGAAAHAQPRRSRSSPPSVSRRPTPPAGTRPDGGAAARGGRAPTRSRGPPVTARRSGSAADARPTASPAAPAPAPAPRARAHLEAARRKAAAGLIDQALADFDDLVAAVGHDAAAALLAARSRSRARQTEAMASLIEFDARFPKARSPTRGSSSSASCCATRQVASREALAAFAVVVDSYPGSAYVPASLAHQADIEEELKMTAQDEVLSRKVPASLVSLRTLVERFPTDQATENGAWELAEQYKSLGLHAEAVKIYHQLGTSFPSKTRDAWWEAGQLLEDKLSDEAGALAAYQQVPESSRSHSKAQRRVKKLWLTR